MTLSSNEQNDITTDYARQSYLTDDNPANVTWPDIIAAAVALDSFITDNFTALNNAFPTAFKTNATNQEKLRLFKHVVARLELQ